MLRASIPKTLGLIALLNIITDTEIVCNEQNSLNRILKTFEGEKMITQCIVLNYLADLYCSEYNHVIKYDESNHVKYNNKKKAHTFLYYIYVKNMYIYKETDR